MTLIWCKGPILALIWCKKKMYSLIWCKKKMYALIWCTVWDAALIWCTTWRHSPNLVYRLHRRCPNLVGCLFGEGERPSAGCLFGEGRSAEKKREAALFGSGGKGRGEKRLCSEAAAAAQAAHHE